jgi:hypothetical protein
MATTLTLDFGCKRLNETVTLGFDFVNLLATGETLSTAVQWVAAVKEGTDATPSAIVSGAAAIVGTKAVQNITAGVDGVVYWLEGQVTTSAGQTLEGIGTLTIDDVEV